MKQKRIQPKLLIASLVLAGVVGTGIGAFFIFFIHSNPATPQDKNPDEEITYLNTTPKSKELFFDIPKSSSPLREASTDQQTKSVQESATSENLKTLELNFRHIIFRHPSESEKAGLFFQFLGVERFLKQKLEVFFEESSSQNSTPLSYFVDINSSFASLSIDDLKINTNYKFWFAINGQKSKTQLLKTTPFALPKISSVEVEFSLTKISLSNLQAFFKDKQKHPLLKNFRLYLAYKRANQPNDLIQKVEITSNGEDTQTLNLENLRPNSTYEFFFSLSNDFLVFDFETTKSALTYNRIATEVADPLVKVVGKNFVTLAIENLRYQPMSGKRFQFFLEPALGRTSRSEIERFSIFSPQINPDQPPKNALVFFDQNLGVLNLEYTFYNLDEKQEYFVRVVEFQENLYKKEEKSISQESKSIIFQKESEAPDFTLAPLPRPNFWYLSTNSALIEIPLSQFLTQQNPKFLYRKVGDSLYSQLPFINSGQGLFVFLEKLLPQTKYEFLVEDDQSKIFYNQQFSTFSLPHLDKSLSQFGFTDAKLHFVSLKEEPNQKISLLISALDGEGKAKKTFNFEKILKTSNLEFNFPYLSPNTPYSYQLFDQNQKLLTQGTFRTKKPITHFINVGVESATIFFERNKSVAWGDIFTNKDFFVEYRKKGELGIKDSIRASNSHLEFGNFEIKNLDPNTLYEYRFSLFEEGNFIDLGHGEFQTLDKEVFKHIVQPQKSDTYHFEFLTKDYYDWNFFLEFLPTVDFWPNQESDAKNTHSNIGSKFFFPTQITPQNDKYLYTFDIPQQNLEFNQHYRVKLIARRNFKASTDVDLSTSISSLNFKTNPPQLEDPIQSRVTLVQSTSTNDQQTNGVFKTILTPQLYESMIKDRSFDYFVNYKIQATDAQILDALGLDLSIEKTKEFLKRKRGSLPVFATLFRKESATLAQENKQEETKDSNPKNPPQTNELNYYQYTFVIENLLPNFSYSFELIKQRRGFSAQSPVFTSQISIPATTTADNVYLESLYYDQKGIHFNFQNLIDFEDFQNLYMNFKFNYKKRSNKKYDYTQPKNFLALGSFTENLSQTINRFNKVNVGPDFRAAFSISWKTLESMYGINLKDVESIDWFLEGAYKRLTNTFETPNDFDSWFTITKNSSEEPIWLNNLVWVEKLEQKNNSLSVALSVPPQLKNHLELRYFSLPNNNQILNFDPILHTSSTSLWNIATSLSWVDNQLFWSKKNLDKNSFYFLALVDKNNPDQTLWISQPIKSQELSTQVSGQSAKVIPKKPSNSNNGSTFLLHGIKTFYTTPKTPIETKNSQSLLLGDLVPNKRYFYQVVDQFNQPLTNRVEFVTKAPITYSILKNESNKVSIRFEGLFAYGNKFFDNRLSQLFNRERNFEPKISTIPMLLEWRELGAQNWTQKRLYVDPATSMEEVSIEELLPNRNYEFRLLSLNSLKPNGELISRLLSQKSSFGEETNSESLYGQLLEKFLDYFYYRLDGDKIQILEHFEKESFEQDIKKFLFALAQHQYVQQDLLESYTTRFFTLLRYFLENLKLSDFNLHTSREFLIEQFQKDLKAFFSSFDLTKISTLTLSSIFQSDKQFFEEALKNQQLLNLLQPLGDNPLSTYPTFVTANFESKIFVSHSKVLWTLPKNLITTLASPSKPANLLMVLRDHKTSKHQVRVVGSLQLEIIQKTRKILTQIKELRDQFNSLNLIKQKSRKGKDLLEEIAKLDETITSHWVVDLTTQPWQFEFNQDTTYTFDFYVQEPGSSDTLPIFNHTFTTKSPIKVEPLESNYPSIIALKVHGVRNYANTQFIAYFKKHEYQDSDQFFNESLVSDIDFINSPLSTKKPLLWENNKMELLSDQWYYKIFTIPQNVDSVNAYINVGVDDLKIDYVILPFNPQLQEFLVKSYDFLPLDSQSGSVLSGSKPKETTFEAKEFVFEGDLFSYTWSKVANLNELGLIGLNAFSGDTELEGWEKPLIESLKSVRVNSQIDNKAFSKWYSIPKDQTILNKNWFVWEDPKTQERFLVYYIGARWDEDNSKVVFFELHFRLVGDEISARVVALKNLPSYSFEDYSKIKWQNLVGSNVDFQNFDLNNFANNYLLTGLNFEFFAPTLSPSTSKTSIRRYNLTTKQSPETLSAQRVSKNEFQLLNNLLDDYYFDPLNEFETKMQQLWAGARFLFMGNLNQNNSWISFGNNSENLRYFFTKGVDQKGIGIRLLYRQQQEVFGFELSAQPFFENNVLKLKVTLTSNPLKAYLDTFLTFEQLTWESFLNFATPISLANSPWDSGINIAGIQFDVNLAPLQQRKKPLTQLQFSYSSQPLNLPQPIHHQPLSLNTPLLFNKPYLYDPGFAKTSLKFKGLTPDKDYIFLYWLKGSKSLREKITQLTSEFLEKDDESQMVEITQGFLKFTSSKEGEFLLQIDKLALNTFYSFEVFELEEFKNNLTNFNISPIIESSFLSYVFSNEQLFRPPQGYTNSFRSSGWMAQESNYRWWKWMLSPLYYTSKFLLGRLPIIGNFFSSTPPAQNPALNDPMGTIFVPKTPPHLVIPDNIYQLTKWIYYNKSFSFDFKKVFGQNETANNTWLSRPGHDRLDRWAQFVQSFSPQTVSGEDQQKVTVFGSEPTQQLARLRNFIEQNIKYLRVGGSVFGLDQPGQGEWLDAKLRKDAYTKIIDFDGVGSFLGSKFSPTNNVLKLYYLVNISSSIPNTLKDSEMFRGLVLSFTVFLPSEQDFDYYQEFTNRIYTSIDGVVEFAQAQKDEFLEQLKSLQFEEFRAKNINVVENYQQLIDNNYNNAVFISDLLFSEPTL